MAGLLRAAKKPMALSGASLRLVGPREAQAPLQRRKQQKKQEEEEGAQEQVAVAGGEKAGAGRSGCGEPQSLATTPGALENKDKGLAGAVLGRTLNNSCTFKATGSACVDFFFHVHQLTEREEVESRLAAAWAEDPLTALKLVMQLRAVRGTGKSDKGNFFLAAMWLYYHHPQTLLANLPLLPSFGCFKDLLVLVRRALDNDPEGRLDQWPRMQWQGRGSGKAHRAREERRRQREAQLGGQAEPREVRVQRNREDMERRSLEAAQARREKRAELAATVLLQYERDQRFRSLHDAVAQCFADALRQDLAALEKWNRQQRCLEQQQQQPGVGGKGEEEAQAREQGDEGSRGKQEEKTGKGKWLGKKGPRLTLAAKWAPSLDNSFDRRTLLPESIAQRVFPPTDAELATLEAICTVPEAGASSEGAAPPPPAPASALVAPPSAEEHLRAFRLRDRLRKEVLVPLRCAMELPEVYMSARRWGELPYGRVASVCMKQNKKHFDTHDKERFAEYLADVRQGKAKVAAGALLPHDILRSVRRQEEQEAGTEQEVGELQWQAMVADVKEKGTFSNCIAVCDVSGSMYGLPMEVGVALSLLISDISEEPWKRHLISFSEHPEIHEIKGETLEERAAFTEDMDWGMSTNFQAVFELLLERARAFSLRPQDMVRRIYVFSDMEFNEASASDTWATDHEEVVRKYTEAGYPVPQIVYWNLSQWGSGSTPVSMEEAGTALVSGFSKNILTAMLDGEEITPLLVMEQAIQGKLYGQLQLVD